MNDPKEDNDQDLESNTWMGLTSTYPKSLMIWLVKEKELAHHTARKTNRLLIAAILNNLAYWNYDDSPPRHQETSQKNTRPVPQYHPSVFYKIRVSLSNIHSMGTMPSNYFVSISCITMYLMVSTFWCHKASLSFLNLHNHFPNKAQFLTKIFPTSNPCNF